MPCQQFFPQVARACIMLDIPLRIMDITNDWATAQELGIQSTPALIVYENDEPAGFIESRRLVPLLQELRLRFELDSNLKIT